MLGDILPLRFHINYVTSYEMYMSGFGDLYSSPEEVLLASEKSSMHKRLSTSFKMYNLHFEYLNI